MPFIPQMSNDDCGIAALAMLCDVSYAEAYNAIPWPNNRCQGPTTTKLIVGGAKRLGYRAKGARLRPLRLDGIGGWSGIEANSLVKIPHPAGRRWHWVVWRKQRIYDPAMGVFLPKNYPLGKPVSRLQFVKEVDNV